MSAWVRHFTLFLVVNLFPPEGRRVFPQAGCVLRDPADRKAVPLPFSFLPGNLDRQRNRPPWTLPAQGHGKVERYLYFEQIFIKFLQVRAVADASVTVARGPG